MKEWIRRIVVVACATIGVVFAWQQWRDESALQSSGTWWMVALAVVGVVAGATTLLTRREGLVAAVALAFVCVTPGFYPLNAVVLVWAIVAIVLAVKRHTRTTVASGVKVGSSS
jgi:hypothetical protein